MISHNQVIEGQIVWFWWYPYGLTQGTIRDWAPAEYRERYSHTMVDVEWMENSQLRNHIFALDKLFMTKAEAIEEGPFWNDTA